MTRRVACLLALVLAAEAIVVIGRAPRLQMPQGVEILEAARAGRMRAVAIG